MKTVLVTGSSGFIGKNLCAQLELTEGIKILRFSRSNSLEELAKYIKKADFIFHIAGVNRPKNEKDFITDNKDLTEHIVALLHSKKSKTPILFTSSTQVKLDNPYGKSKLGSEEILLNFHKETGNPIYIYRLPGVFGKWCRPNYNSVVATFCNNIANNLPIKVSDSNHEVLLVYIDDVVKIFIKHLNDEVSPNKDNFYSVGRTFTVSLGELKDRIVALHNIRNTSVVPNLEDIFNKFLYATYISYLSTDDFSYELKTNVDGRGWLAEFIKSKEFGQIFISTTKPGISRGDHWHHTKIEKFFVVMGDGEITFRNKISDQEIIKYEVTGNKPTVLDIPTGYVHAIKNTGKTDLVTIFWADEILDKGLPDTYYEKVESANGAKND